MNIDLSVMWPNASPACRSRIRRFLKPILTTIPLIHAPDLSRHYLVVILAPFEMGAMPPSTLRGNRLLGSRIFFSATYPSLYAHRLHPFFSRVVSGESGFWIFLLAIGPGSVSRPGLIVARLKITPLSHSAPPATFFTDRAALPITESG